jgi:YD repeat-containing protein
LSKEGIARFTQAYDSRDNRIEAACFGTDERPTLSKDGSARFTQTYDSRGHLVEEAYFGIDGQPILSKDGFARLTLAYDARGNVIEKAYFDTDGQPTLVKDGIARFTQAYDSRGNVVEVAYFGVDDKPSLSKDGDARLTRTYDALGHLIQEAYFGIDGQPTLSKDGYARLTYAYDARGNVIEEIDQGIDGNLILIGLVPNVPAHFKFDYDARDRLVRTTYFDGNDHEVGVEIVISRVDTGLPAEQIGLQPDDRLLSYSGQRLTSAQQLAALVSDSTLGNVRTLVLRRAGRVLAVKVPAGRLGIQVGIVLGQAEPSSATSSKSISQGDQ